jgi:hypothetical protein
MEELVVGDDGELPGLVPEEASVNELDDGRDASRGFRGVLLDELGHAKAFAFVLAADDDAFDLERAEVAHAVGDVVCKLGKRGGGRVEALTLFRTGGELVDLAESVGAFAKGLEDARRAEDGLGARDALEVAAPLLGELHRFAQERDGLGREDVGQADGVDRAHMLEVRGDELDAFDAPVGAHGLEIELDDGVDFVAEEVEADGDAVGAGDEDVDDAAADGEVAGLLDGVDSLVSGGVEPSDEVAGVKASAGCDLADDGGHVVGSGDALHESVDGCDDDAGRVWAEEAAEDADALSEELEADVGLAGDELEGGEANGVQAERFELVRGGVGVVEVGDDYEDGA